MQCKCITAKGTRCERIASYNGYCFQHAKKGCSNNYKETSPISGEKTQKSPIKEKTPTRKSAEKSPIKEKTPTRKSVEKTVKKKSPIQEIEDNYYEDNYDYEDYISHSPNIPSSLRSKSPMKGNFPVKTPKEASPVKKKSLTPKSTSLKKQSDSNLLLVKKSVKTESPKTALKAWSRYYEIPHKKPLVYTYNSPKPKSVKKSIPPIKPAKKSVKPIPKGIHIFKQPYEAQDNLCVHITLKGEKCSRRTGSDEYCFQHKPTTTTTVGDCGDLKPDEKIFLGKRKSPTKIAEFKMQTPDVKKPSNNALRKQYLQLSPKEVLIKCKKAEKGVCDKQFWADKLAKDFNIETQRSSEQTYRSYYGLYEEIKDELADAIKYKKSLELAYSTDISKVFGIKINHDLEESAKPSLKKVFKQHRVVIIKPIDKLTYQMEIGYHVEGEVIIDKKSKIEVNKHDFILGLMNIREES